MLHPESGSVWSSTVSGTLGCQMNLICGVSALSEGIQEKNLGPVLARVLRAGGWDGHRLCQGFLLSFLRAPPFTVPGLQFICKLYEINPSALCQTVW